MLKKAGMKFPTPVKTGTTIAGIVFKVGVCSHCGLSWEFWSGGPKFQE